MTITTYSNAELTSQLFINVIQNAVKFSHDGGRVEIFIEKTDRHVAVHVKDYGIGMDEETQKRMYDKYFRGDKSRSTHGNGLGLSTVKTIAEILDLELKVVSALDKGTLFCIIFKNK
ncbi:MAG: ATP-binding protein [Clostridia bacterium]|nr:ATP-binding protein [Clostridia bacterium]